MAKTVRLMKEEVRVIHDEIRINWSKTILTRCASECVGETIRSVLSFVRKWRRV